MLTTRFPAFPATVLVVPLFVCGCGDSDSDSGSITLGVTDTPVDGAQSVEVEFSEIEVHDSDTELSHNFYYCDQPGGGSPTVVTTPCSTPGNRKLDLLELTGGVSSVLLDHESLPAGTYDWIRLTIDDATIVDSQGATYPISIPGSAMTGLKLVSEFIVSANGNSSFTIDFDLRKSVHITGDLQSPTYILKPALRIVNNLQAGTVTGTVSNGLATASGCTPAVYVYEGGNVTPDDIGSAAPPLGTANVSLNSDTGSYQYTMAFLEAAQYTFAFTCQVGVDDPGLNDAINFSGASNVTVIANSTVNHNFD